MAGVKIAHVNGICKRKAMPLKTIDEKHFYLDDRLIDLIWIHRHANTLINAANYHEVNRSLNWLNGLAHRLARGEERESDEAMVRKRLTALGLDWYLE